MGQMRNIWHKWRALRLPWRRSYLAGTDLLGNTYWEFKPVVGSTRYRRMVKTSPNVHLADVKVTPQWHQWLRHVRSDPPSIEELKQDVIRQEQLKQLARVADERWANAPSYLDKPQLHQAASTMQAASSTEGQSEGKPSQENVADGTDTADLTSDDLEVLKRYKVNPWAKAKTRKDWQPESWTPSAVKR